MVAHIYSQYDLSCTCANYAHSLVTQWEQTLQTCSPATIWLLNTCLSFPGHGSSTHPVLMQRLAFEICTVFLASTIASLLSAVCEYSLLCQEVKFVTMCSEVVQLFHICNSWDLCVLKLDKAVLMVEHHCTMPGALCTCCVCKTHFSLFLYCGSDLCGMPNNN